MTAPQHSRPYSAPEISPAGLEAVSAFRAVKTAERALDQARSDLGVAVSAMPSEDAGEYYRLTGSPEAGETPDPA